ncbi:hypothetical protein GGR55DRAFT_305827 [Xylaria sp. FL0064]|nr:hypothetical protein GGR55DRAFT_305827 [Xylaria sp. FL0064]
MTILSLPVLSTLLGYYLRLIHCFHNVDTSNHQHPVVLLPYREHACDLPHSVPTSWRPCQHPASRMWRRAEYLIHCS